MWIAFHQSNERYGSDRSFDSIIARLKKVIGEGLVVGPMPVEGETRITDRVFWQLPKIFRNMFTWGNLIRFLVGACSVFFRLLVERAKGRRVVAVNTLALAPLVPIARFAGFRVVVFVREIVDDKNSLARLLLILAVAPASLVICNSHATKRWVSSVIGEWRKVRVVHNGVARVADAPLLRPPSLVEGNTNVLYVGRLSANKGVDLLICALPLLLNKHPRLRVTLVGSASPQGQGYVRYLQSLARREGVSECVAFVGFKENAADYFAHSHVVVVPSRFSEPFGRTAVEAMMAGAPVIAARIGGLPEIVEDGVSGALFDHGCVNDLARKMDLLLSDDVYRQALGIAGKRRAEQSFSEARMCRRVGALISAVGA